MQAGNKARAAGFVLLISQVAVAQIAADWEAKAGGAMAFEVASVKPSGREASSPGFPLDAGEGFRPTGGFFKADFPLLVYIEFAYKYRPAATQEREMLSHLPEWISHETYHIEARASIPNPTKDQMRLMMQSLLADRFQFKAHFETREMPVFALAFVKDGRPGPKLVPHAAGPPCDSAEASSDSRSAFLNNGASSGQPFPPYCDAVAMIRKPNGILMLGYRNATMDLVAASLSGAVGQGRPVVNETGMSGRFDYTMEWTQSSSGSASDNSVGLTSLEALREQLGLKIEQAKAPVPLLVIDKVARPSDN